MKTHDKSTRSGRAVLPLAWLAAAVLLPLGACDSIMDVEDPDVALPEQLDDPTKLPTVRASVLGDFAVSYGGAGFTTSNIGLAHISGLMADEFWHSGTYGQNREIDQRQVGNTNSLLVSTTRNLYQTRRQAQFAVNAYAENDPNTPEHAEMAAIEAYVYTFFAENFCGAIPFSREVDGEFEYGAPETNAQVFQRAIGAFDAALQIADAAGADAAAQARMARIGKARVLMDLNRYAEAAALVADIPTGFAYAIEYSDNTDRQYNGLWQNNYGRREISLASSEGGNGVAFRRGTATAQNQNVTADPRLPWSYRDGAADTRSRHYFQGKYDDLSSNIPLASGVEARLIQAEAALDRGQSAAYLPILNALRADVGLAALADPGTPAARVDQLFEERAMWLYGTAHRLSDLRRLVRQYGRAQSAVFPSGTYFRESNTGAQRDQGTYGSDVAFPMIFDEMNNELYRQVADQCVTTQA
ncbi:MAG TPA: hypothetical protein VHG51_15505 [Longimicrobiaceae bacterium]|nr:hypothetical protein [Longimicrobiaceae bacterium]